MKNFLQVIVFSVILIGGFWGFSNFMIPKIEPAAPPTEAKVDLGSMTMDKFIALGEQVFNGKGTCTLCHNSLGRAPMLDQLVAHTPDRLKDPKYKGEATDLESYIHESLVKPSAFVVAGFGKAGTNDTESPMPDVTGGSIGLNDIEVKAVTAYLQDLGGAEVTVEIPTGAPPPEEKSAAAAGGGPRPPYKDAQEIIAKLACGACHKFAGVGGELGPDLSTIGGSKDKDYLRRAIVDPAADMAEGYPPIMPPDFGVKLYASELEMLVDYLSGLK
ncbi:MAG TPA: c-type cytochrome [Sedimenticola sp.]|nr:c-type cytochrome [Sedimenticola sp.]